MSKTTLIETVFLSNLLWLILACALGTQCLIFRDNIRFWRKSAQHWKQSYFTLQTKIEQNRAN